MKKTLYKGAYRVVSALNDLTGGTSVVARWKVALGVVVLSLSAGALTGCNPNEEVVECYLTMEEDYVDPGQNPDQGRGGEGDEGKGDDTDIMCYAPALPPEDMP